MRQTLDGGETQSEQWQSREALDWGVCGLAGRGHRDEPRVVEAQGCFCVSFLPEPCFCSPVEPGESEFRLTAAHGLSTPRWGARRTRTRKRARFSSRITQAASGQCSEEALQGEEQDLLGYCLISVKAHSALHDIEKDVWLLKWN